MNNTGTKYVRIMKQTAFWREKRGEYTPCLKYSVPIFIVDVRRLKVNTSIFRSLRLFGALLCRQYCAVMIEVYVFMYLSSGKCYTYIMCRVWLWVSVWCPVVLERFCVWHVLVFYATHKNVQETQDTTRWQENAHSEPHTTHNIGITLTTR